MINYAESCIPQSDIRHIDSCLDMFYNNVIRQNSTITQCGCWGYREVCYQDAGEQSAMFAVTPFYLHKHSLNDRIINATTPQQTQFKKRGYGVVEVDALKSFLNMSDESVSRLVAFMKQRALLRDETIRNQAQVTIDLMFCNHSNELIIDCVQKESDEKIPEDIINICQHIAQVLQKEYRVECAFMSLNLNIQWKPSSNRLRWHADQAYQTTDNQTKYYDLLFTQIISTPNTRLQVSGADDYPPLTIGLGVTSTKNNVTGSGRVDDFLYKPATGRAEIDDSGNLSFLDETGDPMVSSEPEIRSLHSLKERPGTGYGVDQTRVYKRSDALEEGTSRVVHAASEFLIPEPDPKVQPEKTVGLGDFLDNKESYFRDVLVIRVHDLKLK